MKSNSLVFLCSHIRIRQARHSYTTNYYFTFSHFVCFSLLYMNYDTSIINESTNQQIFIPIKGITKQLTTMSLTMYMSVLSI